MNKSSKNNNKKYIIGLTDGDDNKSTIKEDKLKEKIAKNPEIALIIIGIGLNDFYKSKVQDICLVNRVIILI